jgi:hypothetical protein
LTVTGRPDHLTNYWQAADLRVRRRAQRRPTDRLGTSPEIRQPPSPVFRYERERIRMAKFAGSPHRPMRIGERRTGYEYEVDQPLHGSPGRPPQGRRDSSLRRPECRIRGAHARRIRPRRWATRQEKRCEKHERRGARWRKPLLQKMDAAEARKIFVC